MAREKLPNGARDVVVAARVTFDEQKKVQRAAAERGMTMTELILKAVEQYIASTTPNHAER